MHVIVVTFEVKPDGLEAFRAALMANASESLDAEPGCLQFDVCEDPASAGSFLLYEVYQTRHDFDLHLQAPHFRRFSETSATWVLRKEVRAFERIEPRPGEGRPDHET